MLKPQDLLILVRLLLAQKRGEAVSYPLLSQWTGISASETHAAVRRGADWVLKLASGTVALTPVEAEAAQWLLARPDVTEAELRQAHPQADAPALLGKLRDAALLVAT